MKSTSSWTKHGKVWSHISHLKSALLVSRTLKIRPEWEIVVLKEEGAVNLDIVIKSKLKENDVLEMLENKIEDVED
jgi:hypothetical protein